MKKHIRFFLCSGLRAVIGFLGLAMLDHAISERKSCAKGNVGSSGLKDDLVKKWGLRTYRTHGLGYMSSVSILKRSLPGSL